MHIFQLLLIRQQTRLTIVNSDDILRLYNRMPMTALADFGSAENF
jgi:hypothetical protein